MATDDEALIIEHDDAVALAEAVKRIDQSMQNLKECGLNRNALVVLLHASTRVSKRNINAVLNGLEGLGECYLEIVK